MPRSSTRHTREIQGIDSAENVAEDFDEYNDYTAIGATPGNPTPNVFGNLIFPITLL